MIARSRLPALALLALATCVSAHGLSRALANRVPLRAAPPWEDGRRHVYHLRDTHWNARGNRIAGEELARFLERRAN